jgi:hypothetical protein
VLLLSIVLFRRLITSVQEMLTKIYLVTVCEFGEFWRRESQTLLRDTANFVSILCTLFSDLCELLYMMTTRDTVWYCLVSFKYV